MEGSKCECEKGLAGGVDGVRVDGGWICGFMCGDKCEGWGHI